MDFPKSVPSVGLVDGKFIDEDAVAGTPGSLIPSAWGNAVTLEILKVIQDAGLDPDEDDNTQLGAAIDQKISDSSVAFATQVEAEAGESQTKAMSPLRVFQAIAKVVTQATESAFGWVKIASPQQIAAGTNDAAAVTPKKLATAVQAQAFTAFATSGTATALTLTPSPAIDGYEANQSFRIKFSLASGVNPTLNVSGKGAKALKQYDSAGAKVAAAFAANQLSRVEYDGVDWILMDQLPPDIASDAWAFQPVGVPIPVLDILPQLIPPTNKGYRYIKLTAADSYNVGVFSSESVTGTAPLVSATGTINAGAGFGILNGIAIRLINTERRVLRGGNVNTIENDQFQGHQFTVSGAVGGSTPSPNFVGTNNATSSTLTTSLIVTDGVNGAPRSGLETRAKNLGVTYYMRIY